eukprot:TRINITY_DN6132_c0_g1_i1.p1 TRINITY_DN6132_c0_g1~~TRINITY_DN6132_c0_g1_i1.p1  ORF type:complete len:203 (+),score=6.51 TRINITY_DN6132_c0_g1_i1:62-670(+)
MTRISGLVYNSITYFMLEESPPKHFFVLPSALPPRVQSKPEDAFSFHLRLTYTKETSLYRGSYFSHPYGNSKPTLQFWSIAELPSEREDMSFRKIMTAKTCTDQELVKLCIKESLCGDCSIGDPVSPTTEPPTMTTAPSKTIAVVVDISKDGGRIKFYEKSSHKFVGDVSAEDFKDLVLVPWDGGWYYYSIGSLQVRYVEGK